MAARSARSAWVSYTRVSTPSQADRDLSLPAQREAIAHYANGRGATITREYTEAGSSGTNPHRPEFRHLLEDTFRPGSDIATIVVHHTSRFTRDATEARIVKNKLARAGVRVLSVCQDLQDGPMGKLMEGFFECIDQYESEINGMRTAAAMREAVRQGFFPGALAPYGFQREPVDVRPGVVRHRLVPHEAEAKVVRLIYQLYIAERGAKNVARTLNRQGVRYRTGTPWSRQSVMHVIDQPAAAGQFRWGRQCNRPRLRMSRADSLTLAVEPIVDRDTYELAQNLRRTRDPKRVVGRAVSPAHVLSGLLRCGRCHASYQLETSGKRTDAGVYRYCYYNCRSACRVGRELCPGFRIATAVLDAAVLDHIAAATCTAERTRALMDQTRSAGHPTQVAELWRRLILNDPTIARGYVLHLVDHIDVYENRVVVVPRQRVPANGGNDSRDAAI